jgi:hypothetical protein
VRLWGGCVGLGRGEVGGLNLSGLGTDGLGEMAGGRPMVAGVFRSGVVFALVYVAASGALFVGSRLGFVVLLVLSQLVAVWMFVARGRGVGGEVSGGRGAERERLGEIVASVVGRAGVGVAVPVLGGSGASGGLATIARVSPLVSYGLADRESQCVVAFYGSELEALAAWRLALDPRLELVSVDWLSGSVLRRVLHR